MTVRSIKIWHTDTLEVVWQGDDGYEFKEYLTIPPREVREARQTTQVVDRPEENAAGQKM